MLEIFIDPRIQKKVKEFVLFALLVLIPGLVLLYQPIAYACARVAQWLSQ